MLEHLEGFTKKIADLADRPNASMSSTELKQWFDAAPEELRVFLNSKLTEIVTNFALKSELTDTTLGQILDGSLTDAKLSNDAGQIKDRLTTLDEEVETFKAEKGANDGLASLDNKGVLVQKPYVTGTYTGDNTSTRLINLGFTPKAVYVTYEDGQTRLSNGFVGGFAIEGFPATTNEGKIIEIVTNGFNVFNAGSSIQTNINYTGRFKYIAFK